MAPGKIRSHEDRLFREDFDLCFRHPDCRGHHGALHGDRKEDRYDVTYSGRGRKGKRIFWSQKVTLDSWLGDTWASSGRLAYVEMVPHLCPKVEVRDGLRGVLVCLVVRGQG